MRTAAWGAIVLVVLAALALAAPTAQAHQCGSRAQPRPLNACGPCTGGAHSHFEATEGSVSSCESSSSLTPFPAAPVVVALLAAIALVRARRG